MPAKEPAIGWVPAGTFWCWSSPDWATCTVLLPRGANFMASDMPTFGVRCVRVICKDWPGKGVPLPVAPWTIRFVLKSHREKYL